MPAWTGTTVLGDEWALFVGAGGRTPLHSHVAYKLVVGLDRPVEILDREGQRLRGQVLPVQPNAVHQVLAEGARVGLFYADAGTFAAAPPLGTKDGPALIALCRQLDGCDEHEIRSSMADLQLPGTRSADIRITAAVAQLRQPARAGLDALARQVGLSHSRLSHLFTAAVGAAPARYRRWRRLRRAAELLGQGERIVDAALAAGFSDAAHLTRTFVEMLGITPGLFQASRVIVLA